MSIEEAISAVRTWREHLKTNRRLRAWEMVRQSAGDGGMQIGRRGFEKLLIVPSDTDLIVGSRGDDAMVSTIIAEARRRNPNCTVAVVSRKTRLPKAVEALGLRAEPIWCGCDTNSILSTATRYDALAVVGADVMDGCYSPSDAVRSWIFADLAARAGLRSSVLGFSFEKDPALGLRKILSNLSPRLHIFVRDQVSYDRFCAISPSRAVLSADIAFLLPAVHSGPQYDAVKAWVDEQRRAGRAVLALNTHPMLFSSRDMGNMALLNDRLTDCISKLVEHYRFSVLLVPHDFRDRERADNTSLRLLYSQLRPLLGENVFFADQECRAAELKALVSLADLLITGRMHLGIGALSMGVPIWAISPQAKFAGLFQHFGLRDQRLDLDAAMKPSALVTFIETALSSWESVRDRVRARLPCVQALAAKNFSPLDFNEQPEN